MTRTAELKKYGGVKLSRCRSCNDFPVLVSIPLGPNWQKCLDCIKKVEA